MGKTVSALLVAELASVLVYQLYVPGTGYQPEVGQK